RTFMDVHRKGLASGLFLTSGVPGRPERATDRMLATLDLLRRREGFGGYVHLKLLPGAEPAQVEEAARLANRISANLEGPSDGNLDLASAPGSAWASAQPSLFPVEVARASYEALLRVPGVGPATARALVESRRTTTLRGQADLRAAGVDVVRAGYYLTLRGRRLAPAPPAEQLRLFAPGGHLTQAPFRTPVPPCAYR